ncbi:MAG: CopD family protein [Enhydrobacter sp.]|nr:MAG: CopD family protein [Enhydrobacter sp.]
MTVALKTVHIVALSVWCAGLLALPALLANRRLADPDRTELSNRLARRLFIEVASPAALLAIASGVALIFQRGVYSDWMYAKLAAVSLLVFVHLRAGKLVSSTSHPFRTWRQLASTVATLMTISAVLWLVLAKPVLEPRFLPAWMERPGAGQSLLETIRPIP